MKSRFYTDEEGRTRYIPSSDKKQSESNAQIRPLDSAPVREKGFFYTDEEGRVRFAGGPSSGGGGASSVGGSGLPAPDATGKTKRTIEKKVYIVEDLVNKALTEAALVPEDKLKTRNAERMLRSEALGLLKQQEQERLQAVSKRMYSEGMTAELRELSKPRIPTDTDIGTIPQTDIIKRAYQLEVVSRLPADAARRFDRLDFSSAQNLVNSYNAYLDRRIQGQHSAYTRRRGPQF
jgi:hypothetical protein